MPYIQTKTNNRERKKANMINNQEKMQQIEASPEF